MDPLPDLVQEAGSRPADTGEAADPPPPVSVYRCKKCRRLVAGQGDVLQHAPRTGAISFAGKKRAGSQTGVETESRPVCSSIFVEPKDWMTSGDKTQSTAPCCFCPVLSSSSLVLFWPGLVDACLCR